MIVDQTLSPKEHDGAVHALFHATESTAQAAIQEMLSAKAGAGLANPPATQRLYRSLFAACDFTKQLLSDSGYAADTSVWSWPSC